MRFKEAGTLYARARSEHDIAALLAHLSGAHLLGIAEDRVAAVEVINSVTDESLPVNTAIMTCASLAAAFVCLKINAYRKFAFIVHQAASRFSENLATSNYSAEVAEVLRSAFQSALALTCTLQMPSVLSTGPRTYIAGHSLKTSTTSRKDRQWLKVRGLLIHLRSMIAMSDDGRLDTRVEQSAKRTSLRYQMSGDTGDFFPDHVREAQLTESPVVTPIATWPALQITLLDKLRHMSENLKLPLHALWYSYASLLTLYGVFDSKSQISAQRTLASRESSLPRQVRVVPCGGLSELGSIEMPWLVPPSLTCVSPGGQEFCIKKLRRLVGSRVWSKRMKKSQKPQDEDYVRYLHFGGLSETPYVPLLLSLTPRPSRRTEGVSLQGQRDDVRTLSRSRITLRPSESEDDDDEETAMSTFLYQPWAADSPTPAASQSPIYWALDELNFVSVRVRNALAIDVRSPQTLFEKHRIARHSISFSACTLLCERMPMHVCNHR